MQKKRGNGSKFRKARRDYGPAAWSDGCPWDKQQDFNAVKPCWLKKHKSWNHQQQGFDGLAEELGT
jgi:hypothetical protein